jgi:hypothetical protein
MKIEISIKDDKVDFVLEVLSNFKFVKVLNPKDGPVRIPATQIDHDGDRRLYRYERVRQIKEPVPPKQPKIITLPKPYSEAVDQIRHSQEGKIKLKSAKELLNEL